MSYTITIEQKQNLSLAQKWARASTIWHKEREKRTLYKLIMHLNLVKNDKIIDVACGIGFHSLCFKNLGLDVTSSDIDDGNLKKFQEILLDKDVDIPLKNVDWIEIDKIIKGKFKAVFCLGSSITYFESWSEGNSIKIGNREIKLIRILENFKKLLSNEGILIIGYSRHYYTNKNYAVVRFGNTFDAEGNHFEMNWYLHFDWIGKRKKWKCELTDDLINDYSFELESHLYSLEEFLLICKKVFDNVEVIDLDKDYYDVFVICK